MGRIRRRKGNRIPVAIETPIVICIYGGRIEGHVIDESDSGVGAIFPGGSGLKVGQIVRILLNRDRRMGKVGRIELRDGKDFVGIKLTN